MIDLGDRKAGETIDFKFYTTKADGTPITFAGTPALRVYKDNSVTQTTTGITLTVNFDSLTGCHHVRLATTDAFYVRKKDYQIVVQAGTVDSVSMVGYIVAQFSIEKRMQEHEVYQDGELDVRNTVSPAAGAITRGTPQNKYAYIATADDTGGTARAYGPEIIGAVIRNKDAINRNEGTPIVILGAYYQDGSDNVSDIMGIAASLGVRSDKCLDNAEGGAWSGAGDESAGGAGWTFICAYTDDWTAPVSGDDLEIWYQDGTGLGTIGTNVEDRKKNLFIESDINGEHVVSFINSQAGGAGSGLYCEGGYNGHGIELEGGSNFGHGLMSTGTGNAGKGARFLGSNTGLGHGISLEGGTANGAGLYAASGIGSNYPGIYSLGDGSGAGIQADGGATANGILGQGGGTSGAGISASAQAGNSHGFVATANGTGNGIYALSGAGATGNGIMAQSQATDGRGIEALGAGSNAGIKAKGGATGAGINARGGDTSGIGLICQADTDGDGFKAIGLVSGKDINATLDLDDVSGDLTKGVELVGFNDLSAAQVNAECDTALADYDPPTKAELDTAETNIISEIDANETKIDSVQTTANNIETDTQDIQTQIGTAGAGLTDLGGMSTAMKAEVQTECDDALDAYDSGNGVAKESSVLAIQNSTRFVGVAPSYILIKASGDRIFKISARLYDTSGNPEDPDVQDGAPQIAIIGRSVNGAANKTAFYDDEAASTPATASTAYSPSLKMNRIGAGIFETYYKLPDTESPDNWVWTFNYAESSVEFEPERTTTVADQDPSVVNANITQWDGNAVTGDGDWAELQTTADNIETDTQDLQTQIGTAGAGLTDLGGMSTGMKAEVNAEADTALSDIKLDHLVAVADGDDPVDNSIIAKLAASDGDWSGFDNSTDSLEAIRDRGDAAWITGGSSTLTSQDVRDAMKLAPTGGAPAAGSVDEHLDDILADTNELQTDWENGGRLNNIIDSILDDTATILPGVLDDIKGSGWVAADNLAEIAEDVAGLNGDSMRGTDNALLAASAPTNWSAMVISAGGLVDGNVKQISDDATAADNLESMLDGTGATLTLDKLRIDSGDATAAVHITNTVGKGIYAVASAAGQEAIRAEGGASAPALYIRAGSGGDGAKIEGGSGGGNGMHLLAGSTNGSGLLVVGDAAGSTAPIKVTAVGSAPAIDLNSPSGDAIDGAGIGGNQWSALYSELDTYLVGTGGHGAGLWTGGAGPDVMQSTTIATLASQTSFTLTAGSTDDDAYNGCIAVITDASTGTQKAIGVVSDYTGSTKTVTLLRDPGVFTMAATDNIVLLAAKELRLQQTLEGTIAGKVNTIPAAATTLLVKELTNDADADLNVADVLKNRVITFTSGVAKGQSIAINAQAASASDPITLTVSSMANFANIAVDDEFIIT